MSALRRLRRRANALIAGARRRGAGGSTGPTLLAGARRLAAGESTGPALIAGAPRQETAAAAGMPTRRGALRTGVRRAAGGVCAAVLFAAVLVAAPQPAAAHVVSGYIDTANSTSALYEGNPAVITLCRTSHSNGFDGYNRKGIFDWIVLTGPAYGTISSSDIYWRSWSGRMIIPYRYTNSIEDRIFCDTAVVATTNDNVVEPTEHFIFRLDKYQHKQHSPDGLGAPTDLKITLYDNDGHLSMTDGTTTVTEGGDLTYTITMDNSVVPGGHAVTPTITHITSECGDFVGYVSCTDGTATFPPIQFAGTAKESHTLTISTVDDAVVESTEEFTITVESSNPNLKKRSVSSSGTINDNDETTLTISDVSVTEGHDGTYTVSNTGKAVEQPFTVTVTDAADTSNNAKAALASDGSRAWSAVDYVDFSHTYLFDGDLNESHTGKFYVNVNIEAEQENSAERDNETFKLQAEVSGQQGTVNDPTDSTVTIANSDETDIVLTVGDSWQSEGDGGQGGTSYLVFPIAKNNVRQGPNNGNITVKLNIANQTTNSADYETNTNGDPVFTCWNRYPSTGVDPDYSASGDQNTLATGIVGKNPVAGHHCAIDGDAQTDTVFARIKIIGDSVREPADGGRGETFEVSLSTATYHGRSDTPNIDASDKGIGGIINDDKEALRIEFVPGSGGIPPDNNRDPYAIDECSEAGCRNSVRVRAALYSEHGSTGIAVGAVQDIHIDLELKTDDNTAARDGDITASSHRLTIRRGQQRSNQVTIRAVDNDIDNSDINEAQFFIVPHMRSDTGPLDLGVFLQGIGLEVIDDDEHGFDVWQDDRRVSGLGVRREALDLIEGASADDKTHAQTFTVRLLSEPTANITITPSIDGDQHSGFSWELPGGSTSHTFTAQDWDVPVPIKVWAPADADGSSSYGKFVGTAAGPGTWYANQKFVVNLWEIDDDAGITATGPSATWGDSLSLSRGRQQHVLDQAGHQARRGYRR